MVAGRNGSTGSGSMDHPELDNPFWSSLARRHRAIARVCGEVARYPADHAPFLGVAHAGVDAAAALDALVAPGESVYLLGVAPEPPAGWALEAYRPLAQMQCDAPLPLPHGPEIVPLGEGDREAVLALTALVYPHYFRRRTMDMGRYFGIFEQGRLAAIIGERLGSDATQEMSAICTHPDFTGRGHARRLTAWLTNETLSAGRLPYLHVSQDNLRAKTLYERMGYRLRREIPFWSLRRR